jgi:conjugal transfer pilus assembly protein TraD
MYICVSALLYTDMPLYVNLAFGAGYLSTVIVRYNRAIKESRSLFQFTPYSVSYDDLPTDRLFIGKGFLWTKRHSEMLRNIIQDPEVLTKASHRKGLTIIHGIGADEETDISIPLENLSAPAMVDGETGAGKTRGYELLVVQAIKRDEATIIFDPKGDMGLLDRVYDACIRYSREKDFMFFALPYPSISVTYNPLGNYTNLAEIADRVVAPLPGGGRGEAFKSFSWQVIMDVVEGLEFLGEIPTLESLQRYSLVDMEALTKKCIIKALQTHGYSYDAEHLLSMEGEEKVFAEYCRVYFSRFPEDKRIRVIDDLITRCMHPKDHFSKMVATLSPHLKKLTSGEIGALLSAVPSDLDWERAIEKKKIVYMFFGSLLMPETAETIMQMAIQDLTSFIGARYAYTFKRDPVNLFLDEFNEIVGENFITLLNKGRGAGLRMFLGTQSLSDMPAKLPTKYHAEQILDNLGNFIWLRVKQYSADFFSEVAGTVNLKKSGKSVSYTPDLDEKSELLYRSSYSESNSEERTFLVDPEWLKKLPDGHAFVMTGGRVYKVQFPLLPEPRVEYLKIKGIKDPRLPA